MPADLERVQRNFEIVEEILQGKSAQEVGKKYDISDRQVYNILADSDYKAILEQGQREQIVMVPKANRKLDGLLDSEDEGIQLKAVQTVHKNVGITPAHTQSVYVQNLYHQSNTVVDSGILDVLKKALDYRADTLDVEPMDEG
jgi:hypothetical protein